MSSVSNNEIKKIRSLSVKKYRDGYGLFTAEGEKMVSEALKSSFTVEKVYRMEDIGHEAMSRISSLASPSPVLAVVRKPEDLTVQPEEAGRIISGGGLFLALDTMRDPGNLGTVLRIADWFGIDAVFASPDTVDVFNPKVVQSTMGAIFRVRFHYTSITDLAEKAVSYGGRVYGTFLEGSNIYGYPLETGKGSPVIIAIGNESEGISDALAAKVTDRLFIPPYPEGDPGSESLNAAVATAVTVSEFRRRLFDMTH